MLLPPVNIKTTEQTGCLSPEVNGRVDDCREEVTVKPALVTEAPETADCFWVLQCAPQSLVYERGNLLIVLAHVGERCVPDVTRPSRAGET